MLALALTFPGGRYHATPWGRHVNEADVEWPPSPWRILRALIATWHRKLDPVDRDSTLFEGLLASLAATPPLYRVPVGVHTHSRHYMPARSGKSDKNTLIFDAFARVSQKEELIVSWPDVALDTAQPTLVDSLAEGLGFLGRAESWVEARRREAWDDEPNCVPAATAGEHFQGNERLTLMTPMPAADYTGFRAAQLEGLKKRSDLKPKDRKAIAATLPESWPDAIGAENVDLQAAGWNIPPASREIPYRVQSEILRSSGRPSARSVSGKRATTFRFALYGKPLPRVEDTVRMGEWLRAAAMSQAKDPLGKDAVPSLISGHGLPEGNRHGHAFWLPEDANGDGKIGGGKFLTARVLDSPKRLQSTELHSGPTYPLPVKNYHYRKIDHLIVHVPALPDEPNGRKDSAQRAVKSIRRLWNRDGQEWNLLFEGAGKPEDFAGPEPTESKICGKSKSFISLTPYLMPWHTKPNFGPEEQIRRECQARGLPPLDTLELLPHVKVGSRDKTPLAFHRFRSRRGLTQPDRHGAFLRLSFKEAIEGPLALGFGCHFGLGLFAACRETRDAKETKP